MNAVSSGSQTKPSANVMRVAALVAWLGVGVFICRVLGDLSKMSGETMPHDPAILTFSMFVISTLVLAVYWFGKPFDRTIRLPQADALKRQLVEATQDDASVDALHSELAP